jgi:hypothetical protein
MSSLVTRSYKGSLTGVGVISLFPGMSPAHMLPSASRLDVGSASQGEQRFALVPHVFAGDTLNKSLAVKITGSAEVVLEGTNDEDPNDVGANWFPMGSALTANGVVSSSVPARFVRVRVHSGSGDVVVSLYGED